MPSPLCPYWSKKSLLWTDMTIWFVTCFWKLYFSDSKSVFPRSCRQYFSDLRITLWTRMTIWSGEEGGLWGSHGFTTSRMRPCETGGTLSAENKNTNSHKYKYKYGNKYKYTITSRMRPCETGGTLGQELQKHNHTNTKTKQIQNTNTKTNQIQKKYNTNTNTETWAH